MPRPSSSDRFDFRRPVAYDLERKRLFHQSARCQLRRLAAALNLTSGTYDLRSNLDGITVSGEVTLHAEQLYVQVSQSAIGSDLGILFRSCNGRRDYTGGRNHFAGFDWLHRPDELARLIRRHISP